jgi:hypothetical protein
MKRFMDITIFAISCSVVAGTWYDFSGIEFPDYEHALTFAITLSLSKPSTWAEAVFPAPEAWGAVVALPLAEAVTGQVADSASGAEFPDAAAEASEEENLDESEWQRQRARQVPPCPQAAPGQRHLQSVNANDPFECTELLAWAFEVVELPVGELFQDMLSDVMCEPGALSRLIKEAWQALLVFLPDKRMGVHAPWAAHLGHAMEILRQWSAHAEAAMERTTSFLDGQGLTFQRLRYGQGAQPRHIQKYGNNIRKI